MKYLEMRPWQIREALKKNTPVALPLGVIEYHAEHLPLGVDSFVAEEAIRRVEERRPELIVLPTFYYGTASLAVAKPEGNGTVSVDSEKLIPVAKEIFHGLLRVGFRNIHAFIAHQTEAFQQGMPTDLAFRFAARHVIFEWLEKESGEGWWGSEQYSSYYSGKNDPFSWIGVHPVRSTLESMKKYPADHAGKLETSEAMVICPECVEMNRLDKSIWFSRPAADASAEYGAAALDAFSHDVESILFGEKK